MRKVEMNQKMSAGKRTFFVFAAIIAVQVLVMLYWANEKSNFYIDELYSMGYASSFTGRGDTARRIADGPEWQYNEWIDNASFKKYLLVSEEEQLFQLSFPEAVQKMLTGRNYFGLLNIAESIAGYDIVSARPGIMLNILFFIAAEIALLLFMQKIKMDVRSQCLALAMFGFSAYIIGFVEYIRFYIVVTMYFMWLLNLLYCVWREDSLKKVVPAEIGVLALTYLSYKNSELTLIFFGAFSLCFVIALAVTRKWKQLISYTIMGVCSFIYILFTTEYVAVLMHPTEHPAAGRVAREASLSISKLSFGDLIERISWLKEKIGIYYFGRYSIILLTAAVLVVYSLWIHYRKRKEAQSTFESFNIRSPLQERKISQESGFLLVLLGTAVIYTLIAATAALQEQRYYCFTILLTAVIFWGALDRLLKKVPPEMLRGWYVILTLAVTAIALIPFKTRYIDYIYEGDRDFKSALEPYRDSDTVLLVRLGGLGVPDAHYYYDCINLISENAEIYLVDMEAYSFGELDLVDEFVLWDRQSNDPADVLDALTAQGYEVERLGANHVSQAYICRIK